MSTSSTTSTQLSGSAVLFDRALQSVVDKLIPYFSLQENLERDELYRFLYLQKDEKTPEPEGSENKGSNREDVSKGVGEVIGREGRGGEHQGDKLPSSLSVSQLQTDARSHVKGNTSSLKQKNRLHGNPGEEEQQQQETKDKRHEENFSLRDSAVSPDVENGNTRGEHHLSHGLVASNHHREESSQPSSRPSAAQPPTSSPGEIANLKEGGEQSSRAQSSSHLSGQRNGGWKQGSCSISDPNHSAAGLLSSSPLRRQNTSTTSSVSSTSGSSASLSQNGDSETHPPGPSSGGEKKKISSCRMTGDASSCTGASLQRVKEEEEEDTQATSVSSSSLHESGCGGGVISGTPSQLLQAIEEGSLPLFDEEKTVAVALLPEEVRAEILLYSLRNRLYRYLLSEEEKSLSFKKKERTSHEDDSAKKGESRSVSPTSSAFSVKKSEEEEEGRGKRGEEEREGGHSNKKKKKNGTDGGDDEGAVGNRSEEALKHREGAQTEEGSHGAFCGGGESSRSKHGEGEKKEANKTGRRTAESADDEEEREDVEKKQRKKRVAMNRLFSSLHVLSRELEKARRRAMREGGGRSSREGEHQQLQGTLFLSGSTSLSSCLARPYLSSSSSASSSSLSPRPPPLFWPLCLPRLPLSYLRVNRRMTVQHLVRYLAAQLMSHLISSYEGEDQDIDDEEEKKKTRKTTPELSCSSSSQSDEANTSSSSSLHDVPKAGNSLTKKLMKTEEGSASTPMTSSQPSSSSPVSSSASSPHRQQPESIQSRNDSGKDLSSEETKPDSTPGIPSSLSPRPVALHSSSSVQNSSMQEGSSPLSSSITTASSSLSTHPSSSPSSQPASSSPASSLPLSSPASSFFLSLVRDREYQKQLLTELEGSLELTLEGKVVGRSHSLQFLCKARRLPLLSGKCLLLAYQWNAQAEARRLQEAFEIMKRRLGGKNYR